MEEKAEAGTKGRIERLLAWFARLPTAVKRVITTVEFGLSASGVWAAWTAGGDMALVIPALAFGLFFGAIGIATITELSWRYKVLCVALSTIVFLAIGVFLYRHFQPATQQATETKPTPSALPASKPRMASTYEKMIIVCDKPKQEKGPSAKERQEKLDQYIDLMKKVFGYTVKGKITEDETTLELTPDKPIGDPMTSIVRETYFIKRAGGQLFVTVHNEFVGALSFMFGMAQPDPSEPTMKSIIEQIEKLTGSETGKCKPV